MSPPAVSRPAPLPEYLDGDRLRLLDGLQKGLPGPALHWLSGYFAGLAAGRATEPAAAPKAGQRLTILYGSQTGNARRVAERLGREAVQAGLDARVLATGDYPRSELASERLLWVVISTQGEGEPPEDARSFVEFLLGRRAPRLEQLRFAVLGLGDSSYPKFCETGRQIDARLAELGATRLQPRGDADVDVEAVAEPWLQQGLTTLKSLVEPAPSATVTPLRPSATAWSRERPFAAEVLANQRLTTRAAGKDVRHVELSLAGSGLGYQPGDALGLWPRNPATLVEQVLAATGLDGDAEVASGGRRLPLATWLRDERELTRLSRPLLQAQAERSGDADLAAAFASDAAGLLRRWQPIDLLRRHPAAWTADELVAALRPLQPRLYSIASSAAEVGDEAHLAVARVAYELGGLAHVGAASAQLADAAEGDTLRVFIEPNPRFRLPADDATDIVMIGAGTGVAPYRGFLQERRARGASGRHWLLFGERALRESFLYQAEWLEARKRGELHRLDVAFSRDQAQKRYVQHLVVEQGRELWSWIDGGATLYVCGDATGMAPAVHAALVDVVVAHGGRSPEDAAVFLAELGEARRYLRDVY